MSHLALHHTVDGPPDCPTVLLSGSLGSDLSMWDAQIGPLAERFLVVRHDHRGHGGSPSAPGPYALADLAGDVLALLDTVDVDRVHVVGLSLGAMIGMWLAAHAPARIDRLALLCAAAHMAPPDPWIERARQVREFGTKAVAEAVVGRWFTPAFAAAKPELVARMQAMVEATDDEGYAGCCEAIAAMDLRPDLSAIAARTLIIAGADDPATPPAQAHAIADSVPKAQVAVLDRAAHLANVERAGTVSGLLVEHLTEGPR